MASHLLSLKGGELGIQIMNIIKRHCKSVITAFLMALILWGCGSGSVSAPPVSLPAPVTGRITVSSPDESGEVTVVGEEGSVSNSAYVMAINEEQDVTAFHFIFPISFQSVQAQTSSFHSICERTGRACIQAG